MSIRIFAVGKRHEPWVADGIQRYEKRLKRPFGTEWVILPHSTREGLSAREDESRRLLTKLKHDDFVILLDERGKLLDSPALSRQLVTPLEASKNVTVIIGGAYGVDDSLYQRADFVWSLSPLVFPHQLVRLMLIEQLYRAQEIIAGRGYHHQ